MSNFFEKIKIKTRELLKDAISSSNSVVKGGAAGKKLISEQKNISNFQKDLKTDLHNLKISSNKSINKIKNDQKAIQQELNYLDHRHFFRVNKNKR